MNLLHITAHLGGGVGKVLSRLVEESTRRSDGIRHAVVSLEAPEKEQYCDHIRTYGGDLMVCPSADELRDCIAAADIVQLEWWHHPVVAGWMCSGELPAMRLVIWSHISGLHAPGLTPEFVSAPNRFLFTSACSWSNPKLASLDRDIRQRVDAVYSAGGFDDWPELPRRPLDGPLRVGYLGTLNFCKIHPQLLDYVAAVDLPGFSLALVGDPTTGVALLDEAGRRRLDGRLDVRGYRLDVAAEFAGFDVLAYLLNPLHYGTTENALLEAMAMGVVPVVLNNPAERLLVRNGETGVLVDGPDAFAAALSWLAANPDERARLSHNASREVRRRFAVNRTADQLDSQYQAVLAEPKRRHDFRPVFGEAPADWFRTCQGGESWRFRDDGAVDLGGSPPHFLFEHSKGSALHYHRAFPDDPRLAAWADGLADHA